MKKREQSKWVILSLLVVIALILAFVIPNFAHANPDMPNNYPNIKSNTINAYPAPNGCDPYPGPYPDPYPGTCVYLPTLFSNFSFTQLWNSIVSDEP